MIKHNFRQEMFVPVIAIEDNYAFLRNGKKQLITMDGVTCNVKKQETIHVLSKEAVQIILSIYGYHLVKFLMSWYAKFPNMDSMWFVYLKLEKADEAKTISGQSN